MRIDDFIDAVQSADTPEAVFRLYKTAMADLGFDRVMYSALTNHPIWDNVNSPCIVSNYPADWVKYYMEQGYVQTDPVRKYGAFLHAPFTWRNLAETVKLSQLEQRILWEGDEAGLHDGVGVPLHGPNGEVMGVGLASSVGRVDAAQHLGQIHALTVQFHVAFSSLALPAVPIITPGVGSSGRGAVIREGGWGQQLYDDKCGREINLILP